MTIPQTIKNIASDADFVNIVPRRFSTLELIAASTKLAKQIAGNDAPQRPAYLQAVPAYLKTLPSSTPDALEIVRKDAAEVLALPGMATDAVALSKAIAKREKADADVADAEALQGRRLAQIQTLEKQVEELQNSLSIWDQNFDQIITDQETLILEYFGKAVVSAPFDQINQANILKRLAPGKIAEIRKDLADTEKQLASLKS